MIDPVVCDVWVPATTAVAFRRFTAEIDGWWPRATHSVSQSRCARVAVEPLVGGRVFETAEDGSKHVWGRVRAWDEPSGFEMTWHPGRPEAQAQAVEVTFRAENGGTRVRLTHSGWEALGEEAYETRGDYAGGWKGVLGLFAASVEEARQPSSVEA